MSADLKPLAWLRKNSCGDEISVPESNLRNKQPKFVQDEWGTAPDLIGLCSLTAAQAKIAALEAELHEQARQNGMGSEREARLTARVAELRKAGAPMANTMFNLAQRDHWPAFERESFKAMQVSWDSASSAAGEGNLP